MSSDYIQHSSNMLYTSAVNKQAHFVLQEQCYNTLHGTLLMKIIDFPPTRIIPYIWCNSTCSLSRPTITLKYALYICCKYSGLVC